MEHAKEFANLCSGKPDRKKCVEMQDTGTSDIELVLICFNDVERECGALQKLIPLIAIINFVCAII